MKAATQNRTEKKTDVNTYWQSRYDAHYYAALNTKHPQVSIRQHDLENLVLSATVAEREDNYYTVCLEGLDAEQAKQLTYRKALYSLMMRAVIGTEPISKLIEGIHVHVKADFQFGVAVIETLHKIDRKIHEYECYEAIPGLHAVRDAIETLFDLPAWLIGHNDFDPTPLTQKARQ